MAPPPRTLALWHFGTLALLALLAPFGWFAAACVATLAFYGFYVALAEHVQAPLITADARLLRALKGKSYPVLSLAEFGSAGQS